MVFLVACCVAILFICPPNMKLNRCFWLSLRFTKRHSHMRNILRIKRKLSVPREAFLQHPANRIFTKADVRKCSNAVVTIPGSKDTFSLHGAITRKSQQSITVTGMVSKRAVTLNVPIHSPIVHVKLVRDVGM
jgi:hypothetical protein